MTAERESLLHHVPTAYKIQVCGRCRASLDWCADDGEGMAARAWCCGAERHLVVDWPGSHTEPLTITVQEVEVV